MTCVTHFETISLGSFGTFTVGWGDITIKQNSANVGIKVKSGSMINQINPIVWNATVKMLDVTSSLVSAFRSAQASALKSYIKTGQGNLNITASGVSLTGCIVKGLDVGQLYITQEGVRKVSEVTVTLERPVLNWI